MQKPKLGYMLGNVASQIWHEVWSWESRLTYKMGNSEYYNTIYENFVFISASNNNDIKKIVAH
jgi:hypothetical protein